MLRFPANFLRSGLVWLLVLPLVPAAAKPPVNNTESSEGEAVFSLLPRSFQKNPLVDQTVLTEMTPEGRKLPLPTRESPAYYRAEPGGFRSEGHDPTNETPPSAAMLEHSLRRALAINSYQPATPEHPPALLIIYHWGQHNNLDQGSGEVGDTGFLDVRHKNLLSRAALVGGTKFADELRVALNKQDREDQNRAGLAPEISSMLTNFGPLRQFTERDAKTRQLYEESRAECYYVIASAYDYVSAVRGERRLLWRSKMTVEASGVAMSDTLPALIANAARYLGRDMPEAATMAKPILRGEQIRLGPLEVKEYMDKLPEQPPGKITGKP
jgi:hypothetical protein